MPPGEERGPRIAVSWIDFSMYETAAECVRMDASVGKW